MLRIPDAPLAHRGHRHAIALPSQDVWQRLGTGLALLLLWLERSRQRRDLAELQDHQLRDVGLTRADARRECGKPFWR